MSLILDLLFPRLCYGCRRPGHYFCPACLRQLPSLAINYQNKGRLDACLGLFKYHSAMKNALLDLKFNFVTDLAGELSQLCADRIRQEYPSVLQYWLDEKFVLVPIPLHPYRHNWRGFNQAALLGGKVARLLGLEYTDGLLCRGRNTQAQSKLKDKTSRQDNVSRAFEINPDWKGRIPENIILFDDVTTTRSTLNSAASVFNAWPGTHCWGLTVAG